MSSSAITSPNLMTAVWPGRTGALGLVRAGVIVVLASIVLTVSAKVQVPFFPVPMTLQTGAVVLLALAMGLRLSLAAVLLYIAEGAVGLPVFAGTPEKGLGLAYMMGSTGGYIAGFVLATLIVGWLADRGAGARLSTALAATVLGMVLIYIPGVLWLGQVIGWSKPVLQYGLTPFLLGDAVKAALAALIVRGGFQAVGR